MKAMTIKSADHLSWRAVVSLTGFLLLLLMACLSGAANPRLALAQSKSDKPTTTTCVPVWNVVNSPASGSSNNILYEVAAVSTNDVWAVGYSENTSSRYQTLIEHWNGTDWSEVSGPNVGADSNYLLGIAAVSANDIWASGAYCTSHCSTGAEVDQTLIEHWNGTDWSVVPSPNSNTGSNFLYEVTAMSANDVWAVGGYSYSNGTTYQTQALIEHWNGAAWSVVPNPNVGTGSNYLDAVAAVSANDVWAVGGYFDFTNPNEPVYQTLVEHWNGTAWSVVPSPNVSLFNYLSAVAVVSANDVWAVGSSDSSTLVEHWNGTAWSVVLGPNVVAAFSSLSGVAAVSANDVWAVGYYFGASGPSRTLTAHWDGTQWSLVNSPSPGSTDNTLAGVAAISANDVWAVGRYGNIHNPFQTLALTYTDTGATFTDVQPDNVFYNYIRGLSCIGAISGYGDGAFRPNNTTTRAQLTKIAVLALGFAINTHGGPHLTDMPPTSVFYPYVETAFNRGLISGYTCGGPGEPCDSGNRPYFRPNAEVSRAQLSKIIVGAMGWTQICPTTGHFSDVPIDSVFYCSIETAYSRSIISGYSDGTFQPNNSATRGQICKIVYQAMTNP